MALPRLTYKLKGLRQYIEETREEYWKAAFMEAYSPRLGEIASVVEAEFQAAIEAAPEYAEEPFRKPLMEVARSPDLVKALPSRTGNNVVVEIAMNEVAGDLEEYIAAVERAREIMSTGGGNDPLKFWTQLYQAAREGGAKTSSGEIRGDNARLASLYRDTMEVRRNEWLGWAPFWELLDKGNVGKGLGPTEPYPVNAATEFVEKTRKRVQTLLNRAFRTELERMREIFKREAVDVNKLKKAVDNAILRGQDSDVSPGDILLRIKQRGREYVIHVTRTGRTGFRLAR